MSHPSGSRRLTTDTLLRPVERSQLGSGISTLGASLFLVMEGATATTLAQRVGFNVTFSETGGTFSHLNGRVFLYYWD